MQTDREIRTFSTDRAALVGATHILGTFLSPKELLRKCRDAWRNSTASPRQAMVGGLPNNVPLSHCPHHTKTTDQNPLNYSPSLIDEALQINPTCLLGSYARSDVISPTLHTWGRNSRTLQTSDIVGWCLLSVWEACSNLMHDRAPLHADAKRCLHTLKLILETSVVQL